jgi:hypothetical protein
MPALNMPEPPKDEPPKPEFPKPEPPKRDPPKFAIDPPELKDENDEPRVDTGLLGQKRFEPDPKPPKRVFDPFARAAVKAENPEIWPEDAFLEFPNERHWPSVRPPFPKPRAMVVPPSWPNVLPDGRHPPPIAFPETRADASTGRPDEFPNDRQFPTAPRDPCVTDCEPPKRSKLRELVEEPKLPAPILELRVKLPDGREEYPAEPA